jgi:transcriptional regulator with XRE-family HTH domain
VIEDLKSANSSKIGNMFFDERTKRSLSISDVSEKTLINIKYLNAIESGDYSDFPSEGFARAYFIKYANFLSLRCDFPAIYATKNRKEEIVKKSVPMINDYFYKAVSAVGVLILILVLFILLSSSDKSIQIKSDFSESRAFGIVEIVKKNNIETINLSKKDINSEQLIINEISLVFNNECWIEIYSDDNLVEYQLFNAGETFRKIINRPFKIVIGNADAVSGTYNGNVIDFITNANRLRVNTIIFNDE